MFREMIIELIDLGVKIHFFTDRSTSELVFDLNYTFVANSK